VRGVGSVTLVGGTKREINIYLNPQALESFGITPEQVASAVRNENQDLPWAPSVRQSRSASSRLRPACSARKTLADHRGTQERCTHARGPGRAGGGWRAGNVDNLALYNGQRTLLLNVQKSQDENTIAVVDNLQKTLAAMQQQLPPGVRWSPSRTARARFACRWSNVRSTLIEGALLTVLIVFLFLNSWRSTVITGLTLPIA
jgi:HAE1 family hydrophobic/amphiphilic exporter-1